MVLRKGDKVVSFDTLYDANRFLGIGSGFEHEIICERTGIRLFTAQGPSHWDDGVEMTPSEWAKVSTAMMLGYKYGGVLNN